MKIERIPELFLAAFYVRRQSNEKARKRCDHTLYLHVYILSITVRFLVSRNNDRIRESATFLGVLRLVHSSNNHKNSNNERTVTSTKIANIAIKIILKPNFGMLFIFFPDIFLRDRMKQSRILSCMRLYNYFQLHCMVGLILKLFEEGKMVGKFLGKVCRKSDNCRTSKIRTIHATENSRNSGSDL